MFAIMVACEAGLGKLVIRSIDQQWMDRRPSKKPQATFRFGYPTVAIKKDIFQSGIRFPSALAPCLYGAKLCQG